MRPMALEFQDDPSTHTIDTQYMFGSEILVAPIIQASRDSSGTCSRSIYLPKGKWIDYWNNAILEGPANITYEAEQDKIPLFIKMDSIIPTFSEKCSLSESSFSNLVLKCYIEDEARFPLYNSKRITETECINKKDKIILSIGPSERTYTTVFIAPHFVPSIIKINKEKLEKARDLTQLTNKSGGWCLNDKGDIVVKFKTNGKSCLITIHK